MALTLTTFASGAAIDATVIRSKLQQVETYCNEQIAVGDLAASFCGYNHVYRPDFFGGSNPHTTMTSGESYFRQRGTAVEDQSWWSYYLGDPQSAAAFFPIPGLCATIQIPENINTNGGHRVRIFASFYAYEFGGVNGNMEEQAVTAGAMSFRPFIISGTTTDSNGDFTVCKGSSTDAAQAVAFYPRKQVNFLQDFAANEGIYSVGVGIAPWNPVTTNLTKHCVVVQGNIVVRYFAR